MDIELVDKISGFLKILSEPTRIKIIDILFKKGEMCVGCLVLELNMTQSATSHQLKLLKKVRIVKARREGKNIFYSLDDHHVYNIFKEVIDHQQHM
ncbi:MAG: ArsR/SmtB family transcription factor [Fusobacteriaceae bacterium]